jgi:flagellar M-ring protein FliF
MLKYNGKNQAVLVVGGTIAAAIVLFFFWFLLIRMPYEAAFTDLQSSDAAKIVEELERLKIPHRLSAQGTTILVPKDQIDQARVTILGGDLPLKGAVGFELFNKSDLGVTEFAQKINYQRALQGELARTIMALDEVDTARVHLSLPETGIFQRDRQPAKASITISTKAGGILDDAVVRGIQQLVASAVPNLQGGSVAILDARGRLLSQSAAAEFASWEEASGQGGEEQILAARIREAIRAAGFAMPLKVAVVSYDTADPKGTRADLAGQDEGGDETTNLRRAALKVVIHLSAQPGGVVRERLILAAQQAMAFDANLGDVISFEIEPSLAIVAQAPLAGRIVRSEQASLSDPAAMSPATPARIFWPVIGGGILLLAVALLFRRRSSKSMAPERREAFTEKLKALLEAEEEGQANGAR